MPSMIISTVCFTFAQLWVKIQLLKFAVVLLPIVIKLFFICFEVTCSALYVTCEVPN